MSKYRYEIKYLISKKIALDLMNKLSLIMNVDKNSYNKDLTYSIRSLYFDDLESTAYYEKIYGVEYRKKYRIRIYNNNFDVIRLECKYKSNNLTYKKQQLINREICSKIINGDISDIDIDNDDLLSQFIIDSKLHNLLPSVIVDYNRLAFTYHISDIRITFDSKIKTGQYNYNLFDKDVAFASLISDDEVILEVKFNEVLPEHIQNVLGSVPMIRQAFSKFAICRSIK